MDIEDIIGFTVIIIFLAFSYYVYNEGIESFQLNCIISGVDGNRYCVRERSKLNEAADLLATVTKNCKDLVAYMGETHPDNEAVKRLVSGFRPNKIMETLPTSAYTAYSENKGEKIAFCLNSQKENNDSLIDINTLTFVAIHELSHVMTLSIGHKQEFWDNFKFLLQNAKKAGIHDPEDYKKNPADYCGMKISDNPYYDAQ
jgi:predicted AlkP superfamily phosphohydrolase/phosphomutase